MFYPLKFIPVLKDYIWGGRNLEKLGKILPPGTVAESWEISCHPNGVSVVKNGELAGIPLNELINKHKQAIIGTLLANAVFPEFPLLIKLIDANDKLSIQVHPGNDYAFSNENGESGKNEMWYILEAKPGAKIIYDVLPGITRETIAQAAKNGTVKNCLKEVSVFPGDVIYIPAGLIHAVGDGIILAEVQQNSDISYRICDYDRVDANGKKRRLHLEKALDVIDFNTNGRREKTEGLTVKYGRASEKRYYVANPYFAVELYTINDIIEEASEGSKFYIYIVIEGTGEIHYKRGSVSLDRGESVLIPAAFGSYTLRGNLKVLKTYVPDLLKDVIIPLKNAGYSEADINDKIDGLKLIYHI